MSGSREKNARRAASHRKNSGLTLSVRERRCAVLFMLLLPVLGSVVLEYVYIIVASDVTLSGAAAVFNVFLYILSAAALYGSLALIAGRVSRDRRVGGFLAALFIGYLVISNTGGMIVSIPLISKDKIPSYLAESAGFAFLNAALTGILCIIAVYIARFTLARRKKSAFAASGGGEPEQKDADGINTAAVLCTAVFCGVFAANSLLWSAAATALDLITVGMPINSGEVWYLASPYLLIAVTAAGAVLFMLLVMRFLEKTKPA